MTEWSRKQQILELGKTALKSWKNKTILATKEQFEARAAICGDCEKVRPGKNDKSLAVCDVCGCRLDHKANIAASTCPLGKW